MARDLITKREGADAPSRPIIVQNVASLPAGAEIQCGRKGEDMPSVVRAGDPVGFNGESWHIGVLEDDVIKGVLVNDCKLYEGENEKMYVSGAIMLIGVVNADYTDDAYEYRTALAGSQIVVIGKAEEA